MIYSLINSLDLKTIWYNSELFCMSSCMVAWYTTSKLCMFCGPIDVVGLGLTQTNNLLDLVLNSTNTYWVLRKEYLL